MSVMKKFEQHSEDRYIPSINPEVKEVLRREMSEASKDPLFMNDLKESMEDFAGFDKLSLDIE